jgi:hypothetical protein
MKPKTDGADMDTLEESMLVSQVVRYRYSREAADLVALHTPCFLPQIDAVVSAIPGVESAEWSALSLGLAELDVTMVPADAPGEERAAVFERIDERVRRAIAVHAADVERCERMIFRGSYDQDMRLAVSDERYLVTRDARTDALTVFVDDGGEIRVFEVPEGNCLFEIVADIRAENGDRAARGDAYTHEWVRKALRGLHHDLDAPQAPGP